MEKCWLNFMRMFVIILVSTISATKAQLNVHRIADTKTKSFFFCSSRVDCQQISCLQWHCIAHPTNKVDSQLKIWLKLEMHHFARSFQFCHSLCLSLRSHKWLFGIVLLFQLWHFLNENPINCTFAIKKCKQVTTQT